MLVLTFFNQNISKPQHRHKCAEVDLFLVVAVLLPFSTTLQPSTGLGIWKNSQCTNHLLLGLQCTLHSTEWPSSQTFLLDRQT